MSSVARTKMTLSILSVLVRTWQVVATATFAAASIGYRYAPQLIAGSDALDFVFNRDAQRVSITICQGFRFAAISARPNRADSVNDEARRQIVTLSKFGFAGAAPTKLAAFFQQLRAGRAMNRAVDSTAAEQS